MPPCLYLVFSATPSRMGRTIRTLTHEPYNHVSLALSADSPLYSFARKYCNAPFFGGFVKESPLRYHRHGSSARILVCRIPVTEAQHRAAERRLAAMEEQQEQYLYNLFSAAAAPLRCRIPLPRCYTCVEFAVSLLADAGVLTAEERRRFWSVESLAVRFSALCVYCGEFPQEEQSLWQEDLFPLRQYRLTAAALTCLAIGRLSCRLLQKCRVRIK